MRRLAVRAFGMLIGITVRVYFVIGIAAIAMFLLVQVFKSGMHDDLQTARANELRSVVDMAIGVAQIAHEEEQEGTLSREDAQDYARQMIRDLRFGSNGYVFVYAKDGTNIVLGPKPELEGQNLIGLEDENGVPVIRNVIDAATQSGDGLSFYQWPKPGEDISAPKMSYSAEFAAWGWVFGTGVYIDDIDAQIAAQSRRYNAWLLGALGALTVTSTIMALSITRPLRFMRKRLAQLTNGTYEAAPDYTIWVDEIGDMVRDINDLASSLSEKERAAAEAEEARAHAATVEKEAEHLKAEQEQKAKDAELQRERERMAEAARAAAEKAQQEELAHKAQEARAAEQRRVVEQMATALRALSQGDLTYEISDAMSGEYEQLRADFNATVTALRHAMGAVTENTDAMQGETESISASADQLSQRTEHQAATLEETAAALNEMTQSITSATQTAAHALEKSKEAKAKTENGGMTVRRAVASMEDLKTSSDGISTITNVIEEIAFQTNLLALNAGVEAARAGDAGRGFAVVATEVRALAQRSSDAAREISALIQNSTEHVRQGVDLVGETGAAFTWIEEAIGQISEFAESIASAAQEQSEGLREINESMHTLDNVTQQNASMFEETTAASHALRARANALADATSKFKLDHAHSNDAWKTSEDWAQSA